MASPRAGRVVLVFLVAGVVVSWCLTLKIERDKRKLADAVKQAKANVADLEDERMRLSQQLDEAELAMQGQSAKMTEFETQLAKLQTRLVETEQEVGRLHVEQTMILSSNSSLLQQLSISKDEQQRLEAKLSSIKELKSAIRTVRRRMRDERWQAYLAKIESHREEDKRRLAQGNRGFVVRNGASTLVAEPKVGTKLQVRVLEPQTQ